MMSSSDQEQRVVQVGIAVVIDANRILVGQRQTGQHLAGYREFPGGKCKPRESPADCAVRECREETGIAVSPVEIMQQDVFTYPDRVVSLCFVRCQPNSSEAAKTLTPPFEWLQTEDLVPEEFPAGNQAVLKQIIKGQAHD